MSPAFKTYGPKAVKFEYPPAVPVAVPIEPTKLLIGVVLFKIVVAPLVIVMLLKSSSKVGFVTAGGAK